MFEDIIWPGTKFVKIVMDQGCCYIINGTVLLGNINDAPTTCLNLSKLTKQEI